MKLNPDEITRRAAAKKVDELCERMRREGASIDHARAPLVDLVTEAMAQGMLEGYEGAILATCLECERGQKPYRLLGHKYTHGAGESGEVIICDAEDIHALKDSLVAETASVS